MKIYLEASIARGQQLEWMILINLTPAQSVHPGITATKRVCYCLVIKARDATNAQ